MGKVQLIPFIAATCILLLLVAGSMAAPSKGVIYVDSNPFGAEIYLTNDSVSLDNLTVEDTAGITPREFFVDPGTYRLFLKKYGYITWWNESFTVEPESYQVFNVTLAETNAQYGAIHIDSNPPEADLVLQRFIPNITSVIYSKTPASLESLPPGTYNYTLTKKGYKPYYNTTEVTPGDVTEIYATLEPIPDSAMVTFKSEPNSARVIIAGGNYSGSVGTLDSDIEEFLESYNGTVDEASVQIQSMVSAETVPPVKFVAGLIGTAPFEMELYEGQYLYKYFLDGYSMEGVGSFNVIAEEDKTIVETLIPDAEFVQVYFETNVDDKEVVDDLGNIIPGQTGARVTVNGKVWNNRTPCWVDLPSQQIVNVTFDQTPMYASKVVTVDSTLFEGRPSKWNDIIQLELMTYYLNASADAHSTIDPSGPMIPVTAGSDTTFTLTGEAPAWLAGNLTVVRDGWNPLVYPYNQPQVVYHHSLALQNATLKLSSVKKQVAVNATAGKGGSVNYPGITWYDYETQSNLYNFTPNDGYVFKELWVDGDQKFNDKWQFSSSEMIHNHTLRGLFRPEKVLITPVASEGGQILDVDEGGVEATPYWIDYLGCSHEHEAVADPGYRYKNAYFNKTDLSTLSSESDGVRIGAVCGFEENRTLNVYFEPLSFTINSSSSDKTKGIIDPEYTNEPAGYGDELSFISTAFAGYQLSDITDNGISQGALSPYNITVTENHDIIAYFQNDVLTITAVAGEGGIIEPEGIVNVTYGEDQCFNTTANANYYISNIVIDGVDQGNQTSPNQTCFNDVTKDHNITAYFTQYAYTITPTAGVGGTINPSTPQIVPIGDSITFTITPDDCYDILDVQVDGESQGAIPTYTFEDVTDNHTINADFKIKQYDILVNQSEGGIIEPVGIDGIVRVNCGSDQTFNITADPGNVILDLIVDNSSIGIDNPVPFTHYTFPNVNSGHTIEAIFVIPPITDFEANRTRVPPKYPVYFKDYTRNNPTDWLWDFGDREISTTREPTHLFAEVGNYTVTLTAYNAAALDGVKKTKELYIEVTKDPIASFTANKVGGIVPSDVQISFTDTSLNTDGVAYGWVFGDGPKGAISEDAIHNYTVPGVFQVTHKVEKPFIATDYAYETITILQKPEADFIAHPVSGTSPLSVQFEDRSQGFPTSWLWDFGDNVKSYDQNPIHVYGNSGNFNVSLSVFSDEGSSIKTKDGFITVQ